MNELADDCTFDASSSTIRSSDDHETHVNASNGAQQGDSIAKALFTDDRIQKPFANHELKPLEKECAIQNLGFDTSLAFSESDTEDRVHDKEQGLDYNDTDNEFLLFFEVEDILRENELEDWVRWAPCLVNKDQANSMPMVVREYEERKKNTETTRKSFERNHRNKDVYTDKPLEDCITVGAWNAIEYAAVSLRVMYEVEEIIGERTIDGEEYFEVRCSPSSVSKEQRIHYPNAVRRWELKNQNTGQKRKAHEEQVRNNFKKSQNS